jgi:hypothetical protein
MILKKYEDFFLPTEDVWSKLNYKNMVHKNKMNEIIKNKKLIHNFDEHIDNTVLHALNYYDNINSFVVFGKNKKEAYKYYLDNFKDDYILYGIKHLQIDVKTLYKIMYQLLFSRLIIKTKTDLYNYIEDNFNYLHNLDKESSLNTTVLLVCKRNIDKKYPANDILDSKFCIYIPNTKEEIWHCASVFFSSTSLKFLENQNFDFFLTKDMEKSKKMFLKYRKWLNLNIDGNYQSQFMLFSSSILYLLGHRAMNDLDLYVHNVPETIHDKLKEFKDNEVFNFIDFKVKNTDNWPIYWNTWLDQWAVKCGAKYFEELLANPKYHFYFLGVKIISIDCDIVRRLERNRPRAVADLIALRKRYVYKIKIPPVSELSIKYISIIDKTESEIDKLVEDGGILNNENREVKIEYKTDIKKFIDTVIYALSTRYRMTFTIEEIKRELNMHYDEKKERNINFDIKKRIKITIKKK